jgi:hypothetical protein
MTGCGKRGKPKAGFPSLSTALGNRVAIPTFPPSRRGVEKWKTKSRFPTFPLVVLIQNQTQKGGLAADRFAPASGSFFNEKMLLGR